MWRGILTESEDHAAVSWPSRSLAQPNSPKSYRRGQITPLSSNSKWLLIFTADSNTLPWARRTRACRGVHDLRSNINLESEEITTRTVKSMKSMNEK